MPVMAESHTYSQLRLAYLAQDKDTQWHGKTRRTFFKDYKRYIHILNRILSVAQPK